MDTPTNRRMVLKFINILYSIHKCWICNIPSFRKKTNIYIFCFALDASNILIIHFSTSKESSTFIPRKYIRKYTWVSSNGQVYNRIDHIMITKRHAGCGRKVRTDRRAKAISYHYLLFAQFSLRLSTKWNMAKKSRKLENGITYRD